ncbi:thiol reductant ABC exporter subunit CydC [Pseudoxanthomonas sangjuensis]|uniref:thiol reductant ABC exporter subunit CydC n=1 Tax=Pseudoxanthomonas sangjuensis TaxID=1503750 RepID=UPI001390842A|nr:thiol reductant ABC exporter subunit CydC [Pseudoxanthomonas sangjuensis]KAF1714274.1 thiol reductant ABC exporter subunit CydC [Pseudoxanthomonas sangjuensis]
MNAILRRHWRGVALTVALLLSTLLAGAGLLGLAGHFLTAAALAGYATGFNFFGPSAGIRALTFARILSRYFEKLSGHETTLRIARDLRTWLFAKLLPLAPLGLGRHRGGDLVARLVADVDNLDGLLVRARGPLLALATLAAVAVAVALAALPDAGVLLACVLLALGFGVPLLVDAGNHDLEPRAARARAAMRSAVLEGLEGATDLAAMEAGASWIAQVEARSRELEALERSRARRVALGTALHAALVALALPALLWLLLDSAHAGRLSAPAAGGLFFMALAAFEAAAGVGPAWQSLRAAQASRHRLQALAMQAPPVADPAVAPQTPLPQAELEFREVHFRWHDGEREVLAGANLRIAPGQRIAIHGDSGEGKSSLLALALRLRDPQSGSVRHGGIDLRGFDPADWHARSAWLPQDAPVFAGSVRDNLRLGDPHADDARLWRALQQAKLDAAIRALPDGLDAWIGERGATLSAGQARRLALARALLREAPLLLLDEPTEGLDVDTANELLRDIAAASGTRSVLLVCHDELPDGVVHASYRLIDGKLVPA